MRLVVWLAFPFYPFSLFPYFPELIIGLGMTISGYFIIRFDREGAGRERGGSCAPELFPFPSLVSLKSGADGTVNSGLGVK